MYVALSIMRGESLFRGGNISYPFVIIYTTLHAGVYAALKSQLSSAHDDIVWWIRSFRINWYLSSENAFSPYFFII